MYISIKFGILHTCQRKEFIFFNGELNANVMFVVSTIEIQYYQ